MIPNVRGPLEKVYTNTDNIIELSPYDDFTIKHIHSTLHNYPVTWGHKAYGGETDTEDFFGRIFFWEGWNEDFTTNSLPSGLNYLVDWAMNQAPKHIHAQARLIDIHRILINGQTPDQSPTAHIDEALDPTMWTLLYYVTPGDETNGGTLFYNNTENEQAFYTADYQQGKWVIFPSCYLHQALPSTSKWRMTVGIMIKVHTPQNGTLLKKPMKVEQPEFNHVDDEILGKCQELLNLVPQEENVDIDNNVEE